MGFKYLTKIEKVLLAVASGVFVLMFSVVLYKYFNYAYNAMDLAIFSNVLQSTVNGEWFFSTIQQGSYLADHFTPILGLFVFNYWLISSPLLLLFYQVLLVCLAVWPLYLISRHFLDEKRSLVVSLVYLLNPAVWSMVLFEFHVLPFAFFTLFFAYYFYLKDSYKFFTLFLVLSLMIREDVALFVVMLGVLFWLLNSKKINRYSLTAFGGGIVWFVVSMGIINLVNGGYKYAVYYNNFFEKIFSVGQLDLLFGLLAPLLFLPLLRIKYLLPAGLIYLQYLLIGGLGSVVLKGHYATLLLVACFIALVYVLRDLFDNRIKWLIGYNEMVVVLLLVCAGVGWVFWGPVNELDKIRRPKVEKTIINEIQEIISNEDQVVSSYDLLPYFSKNEKVYSLSYVYEGTKQFSDEKYEVSEEVDYVVIDDRDFIVYQLQFGDVLENGNVDKLFEDFRLIYQMDHYSVFGRKGNTKMSSIIDYKVFSEKVGFYQVTFFNEGEVVKEDIYYFSNIMSSKDILVPEVFDEIKSQPVVPVGSVVLNQVGMSENEH